MNDWTLRLMGLKRAAIRRVAEVVEADGVQPNIERQRLEAPLVYVGGVKELTILRSEYENLIAVQGMCAGDQLSPVTASSWQARARPTAHS